LPPQQASGLTDDRLPKIGARFTPQRPHLVSSGHWTQDHWTQHDTGGDGQISRELAQPLSADRIVARWIGNDADAADSESAAADRPWTIRSASKRLLDVMGALVLGVVFGPLMAVIALLLRKEGGSVIYRHRRIGQQGKTFECLKFRSMIPNADRLLPELLARQTEMKAEWVRDHKLRCDPRVTRLGRFLRKTSLDELPQIWNVLRGEMSLVGPRPIVREELMRYGRSLPVYLSAKPGITGLWQVTGRNNTDYRRRVALDVYYVRKHNLLLDLYILLKTPRVVLGGGGAY